MHSRGNTEAVQQSFLFPTRFKLSRLLNCAFLPWHVKKNNDRTKAGNSRVVGTAFIIDRDGNNARLASEGREALAATAVAECPDPKAFPSFQSDS